MADRTKADHVIAQLEREILISIRDILMKDPRPADIYTQIRTRIIGSYSVLAEVRLRQLLKCQILSSGRPSQILAGLRALDDQQCGGEIIRSIFLDQISQNIRVILIASKITELQELATLADTIHDATTMANPEIASVSASRITGPADANQIAALAAEIAELKTKLDNTSSCSSSGRARSVSRFKNNVTARTAAAVQDVVGITQSSAKMPKSALNRAPGFRKNHVTRKTRNAPTCGDCGHRR